MSYTARDILTGAMRVMGTIGEGETPSAAQLNDGLMVFNDLLDSWSIEGLIVPSSVRELVTLVPGQGVYTMGPTGTPSLTTVRPMEIQNVLVQANLSAPTVELPLRIINQDQYAEIRLKQTQSTIPTDVYIENTSPNETLNLWPVPSIAYQLVVYSMKALTQIANLSTVLAFPAGYNRALRYNIAKDWAPEFGISLNPAALDAAAEAKANIMRRNIEEVLLECDPALLGNSRGFNILTGGQR